MTQQVAGCQVFRWMSATVDSGFVHASTLSCVLRGDTLRLQHVTLEDKTSAVYIDLLTEPDRGGRPITEDRLGNLQAGLAGRIDRAVLGERDGKQTKLLRAVLPLSAIQELVRLPANRSIVREASSRLVRHLRRSVALYDRFRKSDTYKGLEREIDSLAASRGVPIPRR